MGHSRLKQIHPSVTWNVAPEFNAKDARTQREPATRSWPVVIRRNLTRTHPLRPLKVEGLVLVDNKALTELHPVFEAQMLTYLRLTKLKLGLVINFGERFVRNGIHRVVNGLPDS